MKKFKNVFLAFFVTALTSLNLALPAYAEEATTQTVDSAGFSVSVVGDGTVVDHQVLSEENHWTYAWNDLSADMRWSCVETSVPSGYSVSSYREGDHIVLKNSLNKVVDSKKSESNLPLTGQLWWPVPVLLFVGLGCICVSKF